jgi:hypothetical protein
MLVKAGRGNQEGAGFEFLASIFVMARASTIGATVLRIQALHKRRRLKNSLIPTSAFLL